MEFEAWSLSSGCACAALVAILSCSVSTHRPLDDPAFTMACRFPGANDPEEFWHLPQSGVSMVQEVASDRLHINNSRLAGFPGIRFWGNFIEDAESLDHRFF
ncbi:hypothetical protein E4U54_000456 [Claviceps lovelessii]|nr:hypothetical protein E4U54_000456 [Claviceps lovelessii]